MLQRLVGEVTEGSLRLATAAASTEDGRSISELGRGKERGTVLEGPSDVSVNGDKSATAAGLEIGRDGPAGERCERLFWKHIEQFAVGASKPE